MLEQKDDHDIIRNGNVAVKPTNPYQDRIERAKSLFGILSADFTPEQMRKERLCEGEQDQ